MNNSKVSSLRHHRLHVLQNSFELQVGGKSRIGSYQYCHKFPKPCRKCHLLWPVVINQGSRELKIPCWKRCQALPSRFQLKTLFLNMIFLILLKLYKIFFKDKLLTLKINWRQYVRKFFWNIHTIKCNSRQVDSRKKKKKSKGRVKNQVRVKGSISIHG